MTNEPAPLIPTDEQRQNIEEMYDLVIIALLNRLGGSVSLPVMELEGTEKFDLQVMCDLDTAMFHFRAKAIGS